VNARRVLLAALLIVVVASGLVLALRLVFTPERLRALAVEGASRATGLKVTLEDAHLSFLPFGVKLAGLTLREPSSPAPLLELETGLVRVKLLPMLQKRLVMETLELLRPRVVLPERDSGQVVPGALAALAAPGGGVRKETQGDSRSLGFEGSIRQLRVRDGRIEWPEATLGGAVLEGIDLTASIDAKERGKRVASRGSLDVQRIALPSFAPAEKTLADLSPSVDFELEFLPLESAGELHLKKVALASESFQLEAEGELEGLGSGEGFSALDIRAKGALDLARLEKGFLPPQTRTEGELRFDLAAKTSPSTPASAGASLPEITGSLELEGGEVQAPSLGVPLRGISLRTSLSSGDARVERLAFAAGRSEVSATGVVVHAFTQPHAKIEARTRFLDLVELFPPSSTSRTSAKGGEPHGAEAAGLLAPLALPIAAEISFEIDSLVTEAGSVEGAKLDFDSLRRPIRLTASARRAELAELVLGSVLAELDLSADAGATGTFRASEVEAYHLPLKEVTGKISLEENRLLRLRDVQGRLFSGDVQGLVDVDFATPRNPRFRVESSARAVEANELLSALTPARDVLFGKLDLNSVFSGQGSEPSDVLRSFSGEGKLHTRAGRVTRTPSVAAVWRALQLGEEDIIAFRDLVTSFRVAEGRVETEDLVISGGDAEWKISGFTTFDAKLRYAVQVTLNDELSRLYRKRIGQDLARIFANTEGRLVLDLTIEGEAANPKVVVDTEKLTERARANLEQSLERELTRGLEKLLPGRTPADSADSSGGASRKQLLEKKLKSLFGGG
jgi:hypothetical protein